MSTTDTERPCDRYCTRECTLCRGRADLRELRTAADGAIRETERRVRMIRRVDDYLESHRATDSTRLLGEVRDELVRLSGIVKGVRDASQ